MFSSTLQHRPVFAGYLWAVSGATLTFGVDGNVWGITHGASSSVPFPDYIWSFELPILILGVPFWSFAFATAWPLVAVTWRLAKRFEIRSFIYYALCGAVSGFV